MTTITTNTYYSIDGKVVKVIGVLGSTITAKHLKTETVIVRQATEVVPIKLNKDWFLKLGFRAGQYNTITEMFRRDGLFFEYNYTSQDTYFVNLDCKSKAPIQCVHQLQVLFFGLKNVMLQINDIQDNQQI